MARKQIGTMWGVPVVVDSDMEPGKVLIEGRDRNGEPVRITAENVGYAQDSTPNTPTEPKEHQEDDNGKDKS